MTTNTTPPTDDELAAMRARAGAAYPFERGGYFDIEFCKIGEKDTYMLAGALVDTEETAQKDREFISNARRDMQTLLDEVARLRKELSLAQSFDKALALIIEANDAA